MVVAVVRHEFVVCTLLDKFAVAHDEDAVGVADGGEPVRNHNAGPVGHEFAERILNEHFGGGVDTGGGFVEHKEQFGVLRQRACHDEELFLAERKACTAFVENRVVTVWHGFNESVGVNRAGGADNVIA